MTLVKSLAFVVVLGASVAAQADVLVNTFAGSSGGFFAAVGWSISSSSFVGKTFSIANNYNLTEIDVALKMTNDDDQFLVNLRSDSAGTPGSILESFTVSNTLGAGVGGVYNLTSVGSPLMTAGTYYVTIEGIDGATGKWCLNHGAQAGAMVTSVDGGSSWSNFTDTNGALTVLGASAVPEPASIAVLGLGAAVLLRRRRKS